eukprot:CAMPEP_0196586286 /NCGR_PEP_ID=MMETSP1081-20130531/53756_1 /TAXON_ID=36882 /ORGANISM="Pyramimonas amylifera, Strain CCMP720" /LENGTH=58 /DNA_ID=CAMNT_0041908115 /DNA_START=452 /DNA_END=628 /DNA_ORIENTATION=-
MTSGMASSISSAIEMNRSSSSGSYSITTLGGGARSSPADQARPRLDTPPKESKTFENT